MDFEFNQATLTSANNVTPVRTAGDMLITFDFESGGKNVNLGLSRWLARTSRHPYARPQTARRAGVTWTTSIWPATLKGT